VSVEFNLPHAESVCTGHAKVLGEIAFRRWWSLWLANGYF
jgi:hypothetical protein